jgi:hypothetical protein
VRLLRAARASINEKPLAALVVLLALLAALVAVWFNHLL